MTKFDFSEFTKQGIVRVGELNPYITLACDLRCDYCYMYDFLAKAKDTSQIMSRNFLVGMVDFFAGSGTGLDRMTLLGGEPTLHPEITEICNDVADRPIRELRMTTNGIGTHKLDLSKLKPNAFDHVSISIDGISSDVNNVTRGNGTFDRIMHTIKQYHQAGVRLSVNYTVTTNNIDHLSDVMPFFAERGVSIINFHRASLDGNAYKHQEILVGAREWVAARDEMLASIDKNKASYPDVTVRVPYTFLTQEQIAQLGYIPIQEQNYHSPEGGHRLIVFPPTLKGRGLCYMSSDVIGQENAELGQVSEDGLFVWNHHPSNEMEAYRLHQSPNVSSLIKGQDSDGQSGELVRVSHSFKKVIRIRQIPTAIPA